MNIFTAITSIIFWCLVVFTIETIGPRVAIVMALLWTAAFIASQHMAGAMTPFFIFQGAGVCFLAVWVRYHQTV